MMKLHITIERLFPSGAWKCTALCENRLLQRSYMGYTKREAVSLFRAHVRDVKAGKA